MSPRRRLLAFGVVAIVLVLAATLIGVRLLGDRGVGGAGGADAAGGPVPQDRVGPVLLVPGYGGNRDALLTLAGRIATATGRDTEVLTLPGNGTGDLGAQVDVLDRAVDAALAAGAPSVDVVGYSAGGVVVGLWVARSGLAALSEPEGPADRVRRVVTIGSPLHGTRLAGLGAALAPGSCPPACQQLVPGSALLGELAGAVVGGRLPWLSLWTADDEIVTPPDSARLAGAVNVEVQSVCPGTRVSHSQLPTDPLVTGLVLHALRTGPLEPPDAADCATLRAAGV